MPTPFQRRPSFDADARAYIARVETADAASLEQNVKLAINRFVLGCKADGIWGAIKGSAILAGARTLSGALQPLVGTAPTNVNFVSADYNRKTGVVGDGSTKYLNSNRANDADPQDSNHNTVYVNTVGTTSRAFMGSSNGGSNTVTGSNLLVTEGSIRHRSGTINAGVAPTAPTLFGASRDNGSNYIRRVNGSNSTITQASQSPSAGDVWVFAANRAVPGHGNSRLAFYSIGEALDLALLDNRVTALINGYATEIA